MHPASPWPPTRVGPVMREAAPLLVPALRRLEAALPAPAYLVWSHGDVLARRRRPTLARIQAAAAWHRAHGPQAPETEMVHNLSHAVLLVAANRLDPYMLVRLRNAFWTQTPPLPELDPTLITLSALPWTEPWRPPAGTNRADPLPQLAEMNRLGWPLEDCRNWLTDPDLTPPPGTRTAWDPTGRWQLFNQICGTLGGDKAASQALLEQYRRGGWTYRSLQDAAFLMTSH